MKTNVYDEPWKKFAHKYLFATPPITPSKNDMKVIEFYLKKILKNNKKPEILILGCTINYRKLFAKYKLFVTMVDINKEMYDANTSVLKHIKRKEKLILKNWVDMRLNKKYDLIIGDFVINNITFRDRDKFFRNIKNHLKDDGFFVTRAYYQQKKFLSKDELFRSYKNKPINNKTLSEIWWDAVFNLGFNRKTRRAHNRGAFLDLKKGSSKYPHMKKWVRVYEERVPIERKDWIVFSENEQERELKKYFNLIAIKYSKDYKYWDMCPTYVLTKK